VIWFDGWQKSILKKVKTLFSFLIILTLMSCDRKMEEKKLFDSLYLHQFKTTDNTTVEFIDSTICVILTRADTIDGITKATWRTESNLNGTFLFNNVTVDSFRVKLEEISDQLIKFNNGDLDVEFRKIDKRQTRPNISGVWTCFACDSLLSFKDSNKWVKPSYTFQSNSFEIQENDFAKKGTWTFSPSGQLILLNKLHKFGDFVEGDLLILHQITDDKLIISRKNLMGEIITRSLRKAKN